jgi:hypothetical protein
MYTEPIDHSYNIYNMIIHVPVSIFFLDEMTDAGKSMSVPEMHGPFDSAISSEAPMLNPYAK